MKITDKRLLIIDKDGDIFSEDTTIGKQHQEILDDFAICMMFLIWKLEKIYLIINIVILLLIKM